MARQHKQSRERCDGPTAACKRHAVHHCVPIFSARILLHTSRGLLPPPARSHDGRSRRRRDCSMARREAAPASRGAHVMKTHRALFWLVTAAFAIRLTVMLFV